MEVLRNLVSHSALKLEVCDVTAQEISHVFAVKLRLVREHFKLVHLAVVNCHGSLFKLDEGRDLHAQLSHLGNGNPRVILFDVPVKHVEPGKSKLETHIDGVHWTELSTVTQDDV